MNVALGVLMVLIGCGGIGIMTFSRLEARVKLLSAFSLLTDRLASEIGFRATPLPELPRRLPALKGFWDTMDYRQYGSETFGEAWNRAASVLDLSPVDISLVSEIGDLLGQYDAENQSRALRAIRGQLDISLTLARERR
ncbi:MAG: stage III sporulation protein AB, partial [Oscillospiraceae bacterium]|nr:stage III sporulation protein AB [Oscillospiraceae bacterium]